jgi:SAM-dependent methyltransferase
MADNFYEDDTILQDYLASRYSPESPNESLEKPALLELLGNVRGKSILDLGCGDARFALELLEKGCTSYLGIEPSSKMLEVAKRNLESTKARVEQATIETWSYPAEEFDVVVSRLALHYVEDVGEAFQNIYKALKPDGRLIFSVLHPVITSFDTPRRKGEVRSNWLVDNYFKQSSRQVRLRNDYVTQYHRTLETILVSLQNAGFVFEGLREGCPKAENFTDPELFERRLRIPLFLILAATKRTTANA